MTLLYYLRGVGILGTFKLGGRGILHFITLSAVPASNQGSYSILLRTIGEIPGIPWENLLVLA